MPSENRDPFEGTEFRYREITSPADPLWDRWHAIYYDSFPVSERMSDAHFLRVLRAREAGSAADQHVAVVTRGQPEEAVALAYYESRPDLRLNYLWYIAVDARFRDQGLGTRLYAKIVSLAARERAAFLFFEVELPASADPADVAGRRINWYRRQGALVLDGVDYQQVVDTGVPPVPMRLMVQPITAVDAETVYAAAERLVGGQLARTGVLRLV